MLLSATVGAASESILTFAQSLFEADWVSLYRIDEALEPFDYALRNIAPQFHQRYLGEMSFHDPLRVDRMVADGAIVGEIDAERLVRRHDPYGVFLDSFGVATSIELLFGSGRQAQGGLCLMWRTIPLDRSEMLRRAHVARQYLSFTLQPSLSIVQRYGLTSREAEIANLLCRGRTNGEIAATLGLGIATVTMHIVELQTKLGVETRADAVAMLSRAATPPDPIRPQGATLLPEPRLFPIEPVPLIRSL